MAGKGIGGDGRLRISSPLSNGNKEKGRRDFPAAFCHQLQVISA